MIFYDMIYNFVFTDTQCIIKFFDLILVENNLTDIQVYILKKLYFCHSTVVYKKFDFICGRCKNKNLFQVTGILKIFLLLVYSYMQK